MPTPLRFIKKRIKSVKSTRQVTKAMEAVSASKMRKAVLATTASRPYAQMGWEVVKHLRARGVADHPLLRENDSEKILLVLITSDRGLCGGLNTQLIKKITDTFQNESLNVIAVGKKGIHAMKRLKKNLIAAFPGLSDQPSLTAIRPIFQLVMDEYLGGHYKKVYLAFSNFLSALQQMPIIDQILPVEIPKDVSARLSEYVFEPSTGSVLSFILPRLLETRIYQSLLESSASEHSARMVTMRNATDNATGLINDLTLTYNQARQAAITQEIAEISAGRSALEN